MATVTNVYEFRGMNADDMKVAYKRLVRKLHPDVRKDVDNATATRDMQILNAEFAHYQAIAQRDYVYNTKVNENPDKESYYRDTYYTGTFIADLTAAIKFVLDNNIYTGGDFEVEICGIFLWVYGVTKEDTATHDLLKGAGFRFKMKYHEDYNKSVAAWYFTPNYRSVRTNATVNQQRNKYGRTALYGKSIGSAD